MNPRQQLASELAARIPGCIAGTKFGHGSLHVGEKIFAFARPDDSAALKLPQARIAVLLVSGGEMYLLQMGPRTMREWLVVPNIAAAENFRLLHEAMAYVASLLPEKKRAKKKSVKKAPGKSVTKNAARKPAAKKVIAKAPSLKAKKK